jgi:hypothetical protein
MSYIALIVLALFTASYGLICSLSCGESLAMLFPKLSSKRIVILPRNVYNIQLINVLALIIIFLSYILKRNLTYSISRSLDLLFLLAIIGLIYGLMFSLDSTKRCSFSKWKISRYSNLASNFIIPTSIGSIGIYFFTGKQFWETFVGWSLLFSIIIGLVVTGLSLMNRTPEYLKTVKLRQRIDLLFALWAVILGFLFPLTLQHYDASLMGSALSILEIIIIVSVISYTLISVKQKRPFELYQYSLLISFSAPILLVINNWPYLFSLKISFSQLISRGIYLNNSYWLIYIVLLLAGMAVILSLYLIFKILDISSSLPRKK